MRAARASATGHPESARTAASCTDQELIERILERDEDSAIALFHRYYRLAFSIGLRILRDEGEAEDFVQEIFIRLCSEAGSFNGDKGSARTWIIQMIYRRAFDRRAYLQRRRFYSGTDAADESNALVGNGDPEEEIIDRLTVQQLKAAFNELSDKQRETLEMFFFEGLTLVEIAGRKGEDVKNVRHHYYRGLERLRQVTRRMLRDRDSAR